MYEFGYGNLVDVYYGGVLEGDLFYECCVVGVWCGVNCELYVCGCVDVGGCDFVGV